jgi:hypothetical protein
MITFSEQTRCPFLKTHDLPNSILNSNWIASLDAVDQLSVPALVSFQVASSLVPYDKPYVFVAVNICSLKSREP